MLRILQYLFKLEIPKIAIILINIYTVHNQDTRIARLGIWYDDPLIVTVILVVVIIVVAASGP